MSRTRWVIAAGVVAVVGVSLWLWKGRSSDSGTGDGATASSASDRTLRPERKPPSQLAKANFAGRVTASKDGAPVVGAMVCTRPTSDRLADEDRHDRLCVVTGKDGRYRFDKVVPAEYGATASAAGFLPQSWRLDDDKRTFELEPGGSRDDIDIQLERGGVEVRGVVRDIGGGPIAGGQVRGSNSSGKVRRSSFAVTSDTGEFITWTPVGEVRASATAVGYTSGRDEAVAPGSVLDIVLTPESVLAGRVVEVGTGKPVEGALVKSSSGGRWSGGSTAYSDADGQFRITRLNPGRYKPGATKRGKIGTAPVSVLLGLGETVEGVTIEVHPAFVVTGRLIVDPGGEPCEDGYVSLSDETAQRFAWGSGEKDGSVEIEALLPGTYEVSVGCDDQLEQAEYDDIVIVDADVLDQTWRVGAGATITGRVVDADGAPVVDATVRGRSVGGDPRGQRSREWERTGEDGKFEMTGLVAGNYSVSVSSSDYPDPTEPTEVEVADGATADVEIALERGAAIEGRVVDGDGQPVGGVRVRANSKKRRGGWRKRVMTAHDGTFRVDGMRPGEYRVHATKAWEPLRAPGQTDDDVHGQLVQVADGKVARVEIVVESRSGTISGNVVDESGAAVTDAFISASRDSDAAGASAARNRRSSRWGEWRRKPVLTDTDGNFTLTELSAGKYTLRAYRKGGGEAIAEGVAVGSTVTVTIKPVGAIEGTVVGASGPPDEFTINLREPDTGFRREERFFRTGGKWILEDLPPGSFWVSATAKDGTDKKRIDITEGDRKGGVVLELAQLATVKGRVIALDTGEPLPGFRVMVSPIKGGGGGRFFGSKDKKHITDADGRFTVTGAPSGRVSVFTMILDWGDTKAKYARGSAIATAKPGGETDIGDIAVPRLRVEIRGRPGDIGFKLADSPPDIEPEERVLEVALVRPGGPAASTGLAVGDVIVKVDGHDVKGAKSWLYYSLVRVPPGTKLSLTLARGDTVEVTAAEPR